jgi:hypothetical protein
MPIAKGIAWTHPTKTRKIAIREGGGISKNIPIAFHVLH